jgi:hypothetical protein
MPAASLEFVAGTRYAVSDIGSPSSSVALPEPIWQADVCCTLCTQAGFAARLASTPGDNVISAACGAPFAPSNVIVVEYAASPLAWNDEDPLGDPIEKVCAALASAGTASHTAGTTTKIAHQPRFIGGTIAASFDEAPQQGFVERGMC